MKRTYIHIIILAAALLSLASCLSVEPPVPAPSDRIPVYFEACQTQYAPGTRADVDPTTGTISWRAGEDAVAVCFTNGSSSSFISATIQSGDYVSFSGVSGSRSYYAVYPYESRDASNYGNPTVKVRYPDSYDLTGHTTSSYCRLPMVAVNSAGSALDFYNVGALLHFSFTSVPAGTDKIRLTFTGVNPTGYFTVSNPGTATATTNLSGGTSTGNVITFDVDYSENIELNVPIPCGNYSALTQVAVECLNNLNAVLNTINVAGSTLSLGTVTRGKGRKAPVVIQEASFGGLMVSPGPLKYSGGTFVIQDSWSQNRTSSTTTCGLTEGSYYFSFPQLGSYFDSRGSSFTRNSGSIDNNGSKVSYGGYNDWRLGTPAEWLTLTSGASPGTSRTGSTVNGVSGCKYAYIRLTTSETYLGFSGPYGLLLLPDDKTLSGMSTTFVFNVSTRSSISTDVTVAQINEYIEEGCVFMLFAGYITQDWDDYVSSSQGNFFYQPTTESINNNSFKSLRINNTSIGIQSSCDKLTDFYSTYLVRSVN